MANPLTLADLKKSAVFARPQLGVLGDPIAHSLSPAMHNAALAELLPQHPQLAGWHYHKLHIQTAELGEALPLLLKLGFQGLNLTIPHKIAALDWVTQLSPQAQRAGSVNTLVAHHGQWSGHTTDGPGFVAALREHRGQEMTDRDVVILGAGGAARAVAVACLENHCRSLQIANRDASRAHELAQTLNDQRVSALGLAELKTLPSHAVIVNCTALGLKIDDAPPVDLKLLQRGQFIFDTTYGSHTSALLQAAARSGAPHCNGKAMLRWQGALAFQLWTGLLPPMKPMRQALGESNPA